MANQEDDFGMFSQQPIISDNPNNENLMNFDDQNNDFNAEMIEKPTNSESFSMVQETAEEPVVKSSRRSSENSSSSSETSSVASSQKVFRGLFKRSITGKCNIFKSKELNDILAWRDVKTSAIYFVSSFFFIITLMMYPFLYIVTNLTLLSIVGAIFVKLYFKIVSMIKSEKYCDPFKGYLKGENGGAHFWLSEDNVEKFLKACIKALTFSIKSTQKLVLGSNIQSSIKFAFSLYFWTKLSKMFSGLTILLILDIFFFTFPVVYENNHKMIDAYVDQFNDVYADVVDKINAFLPSGWKIRVKHE